MDAIYQVTLIAMYGWDGRNRTFSQGVKVPRLIRLATPQYNLRRCPPILKFSYLTDSTNLNIANTEVKLIIQKELMNIKKVAIADRKSVV